jgi:hypothetical protein
MAARFAGKCSGCGAAIQAGEQIDYDRSTRTVLCAKCAPAPAPEAPAVVRATRAAYEILFRLEGRLDPERFAAMRRALTGARFHDGANWLSVAQAAGAIAALREAGVVLAVAPEVQAAVEEHAARVEADRRAADERTSNVDAILVAKGGALYAYQREGVAWLATRQGALVADDMGLGKTIQALTAAPSSAPILVICPAIAKPVWLAEAARWRPDLKAVVLSGRGSFRAPEAGEMVVTNFDVLPAESEIPALRPGTVVIVDEAHAVANPKAARTKRVRAIAKAARDNGGRSWMLTATPLKNRPSELWAVLEAGGIAREAYGSWSGFVRAYSGFPGQWGGYVWGTPKPEAAELLRRVSIRRRKADVLVDLPAKTYRSLPAEIDRATARLCDEALAKLSPAKGQLDLGLLEEAVEKLAKSSLGFKELSAARAALAKAKIPAMLAEVERFEAEEEPLVVFSAYRAPIDLLAAREGWASITGDTTEEERGRIVERFQAGELRGVACTIRAGGVAITLTRASNVLRVDREWNPSLNLQAEDRCYRIGQKSAVLVTDLVAAHPLDERIAEVLARKQAMIGASVEASTVREIEQSASVEIDWTAIETDAAKAIREAEEAARLAAIAKDEQAKRLAEIRAQNARETAKQKVRAAAARRLGEQETEEDAPRRGPSNAVEAWAIEGLRQLAANDPDRAQVKNEIGFNAADGGIGHAIARLGDLTDQEWRLAVRIAWHYPGQIGRPSEEQKAA